MALDYRTLTDGFNEPLDYAPEGFSFRIDEMPLSMAIAARELFHAELVRLERLELLTMHMKGTHEDLYEGDEPGRAKAEADLRARQQLMQTRIDTLSEWMNEACLQFVPTAEERAAARAERGEAA